MSEAKEGIARAQQRFLDMFAMNDVAGIGACYTEDAQMLPANMDVISGRAAIASVFKFTAVPGHTLELRTHELEVHDASAIEMGTYTRRRSDGSAFDRGKYMVMWKRVDGEWLIHRDMFSTSLPRAVAAAAA